jgi:hypothetical protein
MLLLMEGMMLKNLYLDHIVQQVHVLPTSLKKMVKKYVHSHWFHLLV